MNSNYLSGMPGALSIGTCSWKYASWKDLVYSSEKPENYLEEYSQRYSSVEVDQWFWSLFGIEKVVLPKSQTVEEYAASVPKDFRFVVKAPNSISLTHLYKQYSQGRLQENPHFLSPDLYGAFLNTLAPLGEKLGAISLQFEYLNKQKMPSPKRFFEQFVTFLDAIEMNTPLCIELRNPNFLNADYFDLIAEKGVGHTFCQGYYMPDIRELYDAHGHRLRGTGIIRLLGPDRKGIEERSKKQWNRVVDPKDEEIEGISRLIRKMVDQSGMDIYLNVNNHYEGSAPVTIDKMLRFLETEDGS